MCILACVLIFLSIQLFIYMASLDDVKGQVDGVIGKVTQVATLVASLKATVDSLQSGATLPPAVQDKVDGLSTSLASALTTLDGILNPTPPTPTP